MSRPHERGRQVPDQRSDQSREDSPDRGRELALGPAACGSADTGTTTATGPTGSGDAPRTIEIAMQANRYVPGSVAHDADIGDESAQDDHGSEMNGDMGNGMNDDSGAVTAEPGDTAELTHTFTAGNDELVGCHEPGHYDSGMRLTVNIS